MPAFELWRADLTLLKNASGADTRQIPAAAATVDLYWKGASVSGGSTGTIGHVIAVYDPGTISVSDTVARNGVGTTGSVTAITATTITVTWGAAVTVVTGDRIVLLSRASGLSRPIAYSDSQGTVSLTSQVTTATNGGVSFYTRPRDVDFVATVDAVTRVLADQAGQGSELTPFDFGLIVDGATDDAAALTRLLTYVSLKGKTLAELPAGTIQVNSNINVNTSLVIRGAGRGATNLQGTAGITVLTLTANDCVVESLTVRRNATGSAGSRLIQVDGDRSSLRNIGLRDGAIGIYDQGQYTTIDDLVATGSGWESFYYGVVAFAPHVRSLRGFTDTTIASANAAIRLDRTDRGKFESCQVEPSANVTLPGVLIENNAGNIPLGNVFVGLTAICAQVVAAVDPAVRITAAQGTRFIGCDLSDALSGYHINGATIEDVQIMGGSVVGTRQNSVDIDAGSHVHIVELLSSDNNLGAFADDRADHVNIAAGVDNVSIVGLTIGRIVRGSGAQARYGVRIEAGVSESIQIMGLRGTFADVTTAWISNLSTSQEMDIGHNIEFGTALSYTHTATPGAEAMGNLLGTKTITDASTTTSVLNVDSLILNQSASVVWTAFTNMRQGQVVKIVNIHAANTAQFATPNFRIGASPYTLGQFDTLTLMFTSVGWMEIARSVNA